VPPRSSYFIDGAYAHGHPPRTRGPGACASGVKRENGATAARAPWAHPPGTRWPATYARPAATGYNASLIWRPPLGAPVLASPHDSDELTIWLVADEDIPAGAEIRYDPRSANLPARATPPACAEGTHDEDAEHEDGDEEDAPPWRARRQPACMHPPNLGPEMLSKLDRMCFGDQSGAFAEDENPIFEPSDDEDDEDEGPAVEPPPTYL